MARLTPSLLRCVMALMLLIGLFLEASPVAHAQGGELPALDIVILVDESGSMWFETDIPKERINAFNLLIDTLGAERSEGNKVRVSVIAFGSAELTEVILPFTPVNASTVNDIKSAYKKFNDRLANPPNGEIVGLKWTDVLHALQEAETVLIDPVGGHLPDHKPAIIILSDGKPETEEIHEGMDNFEQKLDAYISEIFDQAVKFQSPQGGLFYYEGTCEPLKKGRVPIYTIAIREGAALPKNPDYREVWLRLASQNGGAYYANPEGLLLGSLGSNYYQIWTELVCTENRLEPGKAPLTRQYDVNNLYKRIVFTVLKANPTIGVEIYRPGSDTPISDTDSDVVVNRSLKDEVWSIGRSEPWAGLWTVKLTGEGEVWFAYELFTDAFNLEQISPTSNFVKACNPIDIALKVTNSEGTEIADSVKDLKLEVETPDGEKVSLNDISSENGIFSTSYDDTCNEGEYKLSGVFQISDGVLTVERPWNDTIVATLDPYFEIVSPAKNARYANSEPIALQVDVKVGGKLDEATATQNPPIMASVYQDTLQIAGPFRLVYDGALGPARLRSEIPGNALKEGDYTVVFSMELLDNPTPEEHSIELSVTRGSAPITPRPSPVPATSVPTTGPEIKPEPADPGGLIAGILGILALLSIIGASRWYRHSPSMRPLSLTSPDSTINVRGRLGGKFPEVRTFPTGKGESVKLRFGPAQDENGQSATQVTLLNELSEGVQVKVDNTALSQIGDSAQVTSESERLVVADQTYDITAL